MFAAARVLMKGEPRPPVMGRALRGLYHGKHIMFGNMRSHSESKTRRTWKPNVQTKRYKSDLLGKIFQLRVTTKAIRCIDKAGGLDEYILHTRDCFLGHYEGSLGVTLKDNIVAAFNRREATNARQAALTAIEGTEQVVAAVPAAKS